MCYFTLKEEEKQQLIPYEYLYFAWKTNKSNKFGKLIITNCSSISENSFIILSIH